MSLFKVVIAVVAGCSVTSRADIISDLTSSSFDEKRAAEIKAGQFWNGVLQASEEMNMEKHISLYADADAVIASLPAENEYVRQALQDSLTRLKRADEVVLLRSVRTSQTASDSLASPVTGDLFSFMRGGQNFVAQAIRSFVDGGRYSEKLVQHVGERQAAILPVLQETNEITGNVLKDCRLASQKSFDALKYDIYTKDVPKTPENVKALAYRLVEAVGETRHKFMRFVTEAANSIASDVEEKDEPAATTVIKASLRAMEFTEPAVGLNSGSSDLKPFGSIASSESQPFASVASTEILFSF